MQQANDFQIDFGRRACRSRRAIRSAPTPSAWSPSAERSPSPCPGHAARRVSATADLPRRAAPPHRRARSLAAGSRERNREELRPGAALGADRNRGTAGFASPDTGGNADLRRFAEETLPAPSVRARARPSDRRAIELELHGGWAACVMYILCTDRRDWRPGVCAGPGRRGVQREVLRRHGTPEQTIAACTAVIKEGSVNRKDSGSAFKIRGNLRQQRPI